MSIDGSVWQPIGHVTNIWFWRRRRTNALKTNVESTNLNGASVSVYEWWGTQFVGRYDCVECVFQRISFHSISFVSAPECQTERDGGICHLWVFFFFIRLALNCVCLFSFFSVHKYLLWSKWTAHVTELCCCDCVSHMCAVDWPLFAWFWWKWSSKRYPIDTESSRVCDCSLQVISRGFYWKFIGMGKVAVKSFLHQSKINRNFSLFFGVGEFVDQAFHEQFFPTRWILIGFL